MSDIKQFNNLNTSYVNLSALIRYLSEHKFVGAIHVSLSEYEAEVRLDNQGTATVSEVDRTSGLRSQTEGAMERLLVHAREAGGVITVHESKLVSEPQPDAGLSFSSLPPTGPTSTEIPLEEVDWAETLDAAGKLIGAIERAVESAGAAFESNFRAARIELGDDYPFLDPTANALTYANKAITLGELPSGRAFISGLSECLRRIVNKLAIGKERKRFRESVAVELAVAARTRPKALGEFTSQLDRIAGTRVL